MFGMGSFNMYGVEAGGLEPQSPRLVYAHSTEATADTGEILFSRDFSRYKVYVKSPKKGYRGVSAHRDMKQIHKAGKNDYGHARARAVPDVCACLEASGRRQGYRSSITADDLRLADSLMGEDAIRGYAPTGEVASARVVLLHPEGQALDWVAEMVQDHLPSGATQLLIRFVLEGIHNAGAKPLDYWGADLREVATFKAYYGGKLQVFYQINASNLKGISQLLLHQTRTYGWWLEW